MTERQHAINGLEVDRLLARGGSASVYEAFDRRHSRRVAVKVLDRRDVDEPHRRAFRRELEAMGRLDDHPYVLSVFDSGFTEDGSPYLVMPYVTTGTVAQRIAEGRGFPVEEFLEFAIKLGSALETAHRRGILHCDIKPSNLFVGPYGDPLLGDLGISSVADSAVTDTNNVSLTLRYAAPEIIEGEAHTVRSDLYSLGASLFAMLDLRAPFDAPSAKSLVHQILHSGEPPKLQTEVPAPLEQLIADLMAYDPERRPGSAIEVVESLQHIQRSLGLPVTAAAVNEAHAHEGDDPPGMHRSPVEAAEESRRREPLVVGLVALLVALGFGLFLWPSGEGDVAVETDVSPAETAAAPLVGDEVAGITAVPEPTSEPASTLAPTGVPTEVATVAPAVVAALPTDMPTEVPTVVPTEVPTAVPAEVPTPVPPTIAGRAVDQTGAAVAGMAVEIFYADDERPRGEFIESTTTSDDGSFSWVVPVGCYVLTFIAPDGSIIVDGALFRDVSACVDDLGAPQTVDVAITDAPVVDATLQGVVRRQVTGQGLAAVKVDVFLANDDGSRGAFVGTTDSAADGTYAVPVAAGCYVITMVAPEGLSFAGGERFANSPVLCADSQSSTVFDGELS